MSSINIDKIRKLDKMIGNISTSLKNIVEGQLNEVNDMGMKYNMYSLLSHFIGSTDYYNTVHVLNDIYNPSPMNLSYIEEPINYGYINADLENKKYIDNTDGEIYFNQQIQKSPFIIDNWTIKFKPPVPYWFHDGSPSNFNWGENEYITCLPIDYPEWNGYPQITSGDKFPKNINNVRIPVLFLSRYIKISNDGESNILYNNTVSIDAGNIISDSLWYESNYEDIRIFRIEETQGEELQEGYPSCSFEEIGRNINVENNSIEFYISSNSEFYIESGESCYYIIYWRSPDAYIQELELPTYTGDNEAENYSIEYGLYYNYFYRYRFDIVDYKNIRPILKSKNRTNFSTNELNSLLYEPQDPIFYQLSPIFGYIDDFYSSPIPDNNELNYYNGFSINYRDINNNYNNYDSVFGVSIGIKTYFDMSGYSTVYYDFQKGPEIYPDMFPEDFKNFLYYKENNEDFIPFAKIIVGRKKDNETNQNSPKNYIIYLDYTKSYGKRGSSNIDLIFQMISFINTSWNIFINTSHSGIIGNIIFSTYLFLLSLDIDEIKDNKKLLEILRSHEKYIFSGDLNNLQEIESGINQSNIYNILSNVKTVTNDVSFSSEEINIDSVQTEPWFINLNYWKNPSNTIHSNEHFDFSDGTNWAISNARKIDSSRSLVKFSSGSVIESDNFDTDKTGLHITNNCLNYPSKLEVYFIKPDDYNNDSNRDSLNQDYTFKFTFRDGYNNYIDKEVFLPNANYYLSDNEYLNKENNGYDLTGYMSSSMVWNNKNYKEYGESYFMPNCRNGTNRDIVMKVFDTDDPNLKTIDEIVSYCQLSIDPNNLRLKGGRKAEKLNEDIYECINDTISNEGVDIVDLRTISNKIVNIYDFWLGVTKYTTTDPIWINDFDFAGGVREYNPETGQFELKERYGYKVDGLWKYQSYDKVSVINHRNEFKNSHATENMYVKCQNRYDIYNDIDFALNGNVAFLSQTFLCDFADFSDKILYIQCYLKRVGASNSSIVLRLYSTLNNYPYEMISESIPVDFNSIYEEESWITFSFSESVNVDKNERYAIVISSLENPFECFSTENKLIWYFASDNTYSYGITGVYSFLSLDVSSGDSVIFVTDSSVFPNTPFFVVIDNTLYYISSKDEDTNALYLSDYEYSSDFDYTGSFEYPEYTWYITVVSNEYSSGEIVSLVNFIPFDPENRLYKEKIDEDGGVVSEWILPEYSNHDASYRIMAECYDVGAIEQPSYNEWFGDDIEENIYRNLHLDSFYITNASSYYDASLNWGGLTGQSIIVKPGEKGYSWGQNISVPISNGKLLGGFNISGITGVPKQNNIRVSDANKVDRYWTWGTTKLDSQDKIVVLPQAIRNEDNSITYIPFYNNMYLTIGLVNGDGTRSIENKILFGYNNDYGIVSEIIDEYTIIVESYAFDTIYTNQFASKNILIMDGEAAGEEIRISSCYEHDEVGNNLYKIELFEPLNILPSVGDFYCIPFTNIKCYDYGTITELDIDLVTGYTTITDNTKSWENDQYNGYILWLIDGDTPGTEVSISDTISSDKIKIINLNIDPTVDTKYIIFSYDDSDSGVYGTSGPIEINSFDYIAVDYMYVSAEGFPSDSFYGMGYTDSFLIRSKVDATI